VGGVGGEGEGGDGSRICMGWDGRGGLWAGKGGSVEGWRFWGVGVTREGGEHDQWRCKCRVRRHIEK